MLKRKEWDALTPELRWAAYADAKEDLAETEAQASREYTDHEKALNAEKDRGHDTAHRLLEFVHELHGGVNYDRGGMTVCNHPTCIDARRAAGEPR